MKHKSGPAPLYLVSSTPEPLNQKLAAEATAKLEECRSLLQRSDYTETVKLLDIVLLQLRMEVLGISEAELRAVCATMFQARGHAPTEPDLA